MKSCVYFVTCVCVQRADAGRALRRATAGGVGG